MVEVILSEKEVISSKGDLLGVSRVSVNEESMKHCFKDLIPNASDISKESTLKTKGYSKEDIKKIKEAGLLKVEP